VLKTVNIDCIRLREKAADAEMLCGQIKNIRERTERCVIGLCGEWQGAAEKAYSGKILYVGKQFKKVEEVIDRISRIMSELSDEYEELDDTIGSVIKSI
jgi:uncharacterized protein YukE